MPQQDGGSLKIFIDLEPSHRQTERKNQQTHALLFFGHFNLSKKSEQTAIMNITRRRLL